MRAAVTEKLSSPSRAVLQGDLGECSLMGLAHILVLGSWNLPERYRSLALESLEEVHLSGDYRPVVS